MNPFIRLFQRLANGRGRDGLAVHSRPKLAADVGTWSDPLLVAPQFAILLQGPLIAEDHFTLESVRLYRKLFSPHPIIVSTWEMESANAVAGLRAAGVHVVQSRRPDDAGPLNVNLQLASSRAGIQHARSLGAEFVLKTRTDMRIYAPSVAEFLVNAWKAFPITGGLGPRGRIFSIGRSSYKFGLYQISDQNLFGHIDDMERYFAAPERPSGYPVGYRDLMGQVYRHKSPEAYLASSYLKSLGREALWTLADSWEAIVSHFGILDWSALDLYWPKYAAHVEHVINYGTLTSSQPLDFREWIALGYSRPDPAPYGQALELPLHGTLTLPGPA